MSLRLLVIGGSVVLIGVILYFSTRNDDPVTENLGPATSSLTVSPRFGEPSRENASRSILETINHLREVVRNEPEDAASMLELATILHNSHQPGEAAGYYRRGLGIDSMNVDYRIDYSLCLFELGQMNEALEQSRLVLRIDPDNAKGLYNLGALHANGGRADSAGLYWHRLISLHPEDSLTVQARRNLRRLGGAGPD